MININIHVALHTWLFMYTYIIYVHAHFHAYIVIGLLKMCVRRTHKATSPTCSLRGPVCTTRAGAITSLHLLLIQLVTRAFLLGSGSQRSVSCVTESEGEVRTLPGLRFSAIKLETTQFSCPNLEKENKAMNYIREPILKLSGNVCI
jgi:hypothetical protein